MLECYSTEDGSLQEIPAGSIKKGCWINLTNPTTSELAELDVLAQLQDTDFLKAALDDEERPRIEIEEGSILIVLNIPIMENEETFGTLPLGIVITPEVFITVCLKENKIMSYFKAENNKQFDTGAKTRFLFQILFRTVRLYLRYLRYINRRTDAIEADLTRSLNNKALFQMMELGKSLVYFTTALKSNGVVIEKLTRLLHSRNNPLIQRLNEDADEDLIEDIIIDNKQALEMVEIHSNIVNSMMDAFASIINNNMNNVMKFLAIMTIILAIPTMVSSFWGMNVHVPFQQNHYGFFFIMVFVSIATVVTGVILWKKNKF